MFTLSCLIFPSKSLSAPLVSKLLPDLIRSVTDNRLNVVWQCDPMHGNTSQTDSGVKTRRYETVLQELIRTFEIHEELGWFLVQ